MDLPNAIRGFISKVSSRIAALGRDDFTCGDCERSDRCGLPPSDTCIVRAEQIARGDWKVKRLARVRSVSSREPLLALHL